MNETDNVTLECKATGVPYPIVKWTKAGGGAVLSVGNSFTIYEISRVPGNTVSYQCTASNGVGIPVSATRKITVQCKYFDTTTFLTSLCVIIPKANSLTINGETQTMFRR